MLIACLHSGFIRISVYAVVPNIFCIGAFFRTRACKILIAGRVVLAHMVPYEDEITPEEIPDVDPEEIPDVDLEEVDMKSFRESNPTGLFKLFDSNSMKYIIDALLDSSPEREFNKSELARHAGISRETIRGLIPTLMEFRLIQQVPDTNPQRYRIHDTGPAMCAIRALNSTLNAIRAGDEQIPREADEVTRLLEDKRTDRPSEFQAKSRQLTNQVSASQTTNTESEDTTDEIRTSR